MTKRYLFETETCSRCGGSGQYSYCQSYGTTCFKCSGSQVQLTKRGAAAAEFLRKLRTKLAGEVQFGEAVSVPGMSIGGLQGKATWFRLEAMSTVLAPGKSLQPSGEWKEYHHLHLEGVTKKGERTGMYVFPETEVYIVPATREILEAQKAAALAFQATLTQEGTPRKVRGMAA